MRRHVSRCAATHSVVSPGILNTGKGARGVEGSAGKNGLSVKPRLGVVERIDFNDPTHLPPVFGRNAGGVNGERVNVIGLDLGAKTGGTIVGKRDAVDDKLRLIFGTTRMQNRIAFIKPAGLRIDQVGQGAAGQRRGPLRDGFGVYVVDCGGTFGIEQSGGGGDVHRSADCSNTEFDDVFRRQDRLDIDQSVVSSEPGLMNFETIDAEGKIANDRETSVIGGKRAVELNRFVGQIDECLNRITIRTNDLDTKLSLVTLCKQALRQERKSKDENREVEE